MPAHERRVARLGAGAALALVVVAFWRLWAQAYAIFGVDEGVSFESLKTVAFDTSWGTGWMLQLAGAVAAVASFWWAATRPRVGWWVAAAVAAYVGASLAFTGHAMSQGPRGLSLTLQVAHVLGAGLWIGSLFSMVVFGLMTAQVEDRPSVAAAIVDAFSPLALVGVGVLALSGLATAVVYIDATNQLWTTPYGRTLLLKLMAFGSVAAFGAYNWRRLRPRLGTDPDATRELVTSASIELLIAVLVLAITSVLVALPLE